MLSFMTTVMTHLIALIIGAGAGWWAKGKYGPKVTADAEKVATKL